MGKRRQSRMLALSLWASLALASLAFAQAPQAPTVNAGRETGLPLLRSFSAKEYGAFPHNWAIVQDPRGLIYVGNTEGVLEFDGQYWRLIPVPNNTIARSLAVASDGRVYVGAVGEVGYLAPDAKGQLNYVSLLDRVPLAERDFADVFQTFATPEGVVFSSFQRLMRLQGERFESWTPKTAFHITFCVGERLFTREVGRGLLELIDGELQLVAGGERFAEEKIFAMLPWQPAKPGATPRVLIATRSQGFFLLGSDGLTPWATGIDAELKRDLLYSATRLPNGDLALGTVQSGLYLIDRYGHQLGQLGKTEGLPAETVFALFPDRQGGLWAGTNNGLARIEVGNPLSRFDERQGLAGATIAVHRHRDALYVVTGQGLYRLRPGPAARFERIAGIESQTFSMLSVGDELLVGNLQGVYSVQGDRASLLQPFDAVHQLLASTAQSGRIFVGLRGGLATLRQIDGAWRSEGPLPGIADEVRTLIEDREGSLWVGTLYTGVLRVRFAATHTDGAMSAPPQIERFGEAEGLPSLNQNYVHLIDGALRIGTLAGVYRFDQARRVFEPDPRFAALFDTPRGVSHLADVGAQGVWLQTQASEPISAGSIGFAARQANGSYRWDAQALSALADLPNNVIHHDADGVLWLGGPEGLFRYDPRIEKIYQQPYRAFVRRVGALDRVLYGGSGVISAPALSYADNALRFDYAAPSFDGLDALRFQVMLDGSDADWSDWSAENYKDYNNLFEGAYRFRVRAKNLYGTLSDEASFNFRVLPPWYRTVWAYLGYLLALGALGWSGLRWQLQRLRVQKQALEVTVAERTADILKLGEIGKELTATLDLEQAFVRVYSQVAARLDAYSFALGINHPEQALIRMEYLVEAGTRLPAFDIALSERNRPAVWCVREQRELVTGEREQLRQYLGELAAPKSGQTMQSVVYLPLMLEAQVIGCLSVQSPRPHAYSPAQVEFLRVLASYAAITLDKARAHQQLTQSRDALAQSHDALNSAHRRLIDSQQQLVMQEKMAALGTLTAGVAHEINNPTNFADVAVQNLDEEHLRLHSFLRELAGDEDPEILAAFQTRFDALAGMTAIAHRGHKRIKTIVLDLRQFIRLGEAERKSVPIAEPIQSTLNLISARFEHIRFELDLAFNPNIDCQPAKLGQLFMSLILNACEAIERAGDARAGVVAISTRPSTAEQIEIAVQDNGCGMDAATEAKVFEPFFTTKEIGAGTGLGLATAFGILKEHGGRIEVKSTPGIGSRFVVLLPLQVARSD